LGATLGLLAALAPRFLAAAQKLEHESPAGLLRTKLRDARRTASRRVAPAATTQRASNSWRRRLGTNAARSMPSGRRGSRQSLADILYPGPKRGKR
jgi:hypothetical protein